MSDKQPPSVQDRVNAKEVDLVGREHALSVQVVRLEEQLESAKAQLLIARGALGMVREIKEWLSHGDLCGVHRHPESN